METMLNFDTLWVTPKIILMTTEQAEKITNEIMDLYAGYGGAEYAGEKVSQLEHMVQAAQLAEAAFDVTPIRGARNSPFTSSDSFPCPRSRRDLPRARALFP